MRTKILLIDRDESAVQDLRAAFELHGAEVIVTADGEAGLTLAEEQSPGLIILSIELQTTSGYSICKKIKRNDTLSAIPLFITSSTATPDIFEQHRRLKTRAEEYFFKPLAIDELVAAAQNYVPIGGDTTFIVDAQQDSGLIEVSDDLIIDDDADVIIVEDDPLDDSPTRVVDAKEMRADVYSNATEAEIDSAIGELTGALGSGDFQVAVVEPSLEVGEGAEEVILDEEIIIDDEEIIIDDSEIVVAAETFEPNTEEVKLVPEEAAPATSPNPTVVTQLRSEIERLNDLLKKQDEQFAQARTSSSSSKREYHALRDEVQPKRKAALELEDKLNTKEKHLDSLTESVQETEAKLLHSEQEMSNLRTQLATVEGVRVELEGELNQTRKSAEEKAQESKQLAASKAEIERRVEELTGQVDAIQVEATGSAAELQATNEALEQRQSELDAARTALQAAEEKVATTQAMLEEGVAAAEASAQEKVAATEAVAAESLATAEATAQEKVAAAEAAGAEHGHHARPGAGGGASRRARREGQRSAPGS